MSKAKFAAAAPENESEVQTVVETILNSMGLEFTREMEVVPVGAKTFKPDFVVAGLDLAIEVKLAQRNRGAKERARSSRRMPAPSRPC